jgi:predicted peroxiredoxin
MKNTWVFLLLALFFAGCVNVEMDEEAIEAAKKSAVSGKIETTGVLLHISHGSDDPQRALMGLTMADKMATGKDVCVYLDIKGIELVLKDGADVSFREFAPSGQIIGNLLDKGVTIMACPGCMKVMGVTDDMLKEGVVVASKDRFFDFTEGGILTLDY